MSRMIKKTSSWSWLVSIPIILVIVIFFTVNKKSSFESFPPQTGFFQDPQQIDTSIKKINLSKYNYQNSNRLHKTSFSKNPTSSAAINFSNKYTDLSFFTSPTQKFAKASTKYSPLVEGSKITYPSIFPNTDLRYTVNPNQLLEEFIVHDKNTALDMTEINQVLDRKKIDS